MTVRRNWRGPRHPSVTAELLLWLFELGWLRVAYSDPNHMSLIATVIDPAGAGAIARVVLWTLAITGLLSIATLWHAFRVVHLLLAAFWWTVVAVLTYLQVVKHHPGGDFWWVPTNTTAYSYGLIAGLSILFAVKVIRARYAKPIVL